MPQYTTLTPNYYGSLITAQQQSLFVDNLYFYVADGVSQGDVGNTAPKTIYDEQQIINEIIYGGRVMPSNMVGLIRRIDWEPNKVFTQYDSRDPDLVDKDFYVLASNRAVYKCISNNNGSMSMQEPSTLDQGPVELADGYIWQYMYRLTENELNDYKILTYIPCIKDPATANAAIRGTISTIDVVDGGNFTAHHSGAILSVASNTIYRIEDSASASADIYTTSAFYISGGPGEGQLSQIVSYHANSSGKWVTTQDELVSVSPASTYEITPYVHIIGNGMDGTGRAVMSGNTVTAVQVLNRGSNYTLAQGTLIANTLYSTGGEITVNLSPVKGHGADAYQDLYAATILINVDVDDYSIDLPLNEISFSKVGLVRTLLDEANTSALFTGPAFKNTVTCQITPAFGSYAVGDTVMMTAPPSPTAKIVHANNTHIVGVYQTPFLRFIDGATLINQDGVTGIITEIEQPDVKFVIADIVAIVNTDTIYRDENSRETIQIVLKIR